GVCGGVSILIKVIGAYYLAAALLFLAFLEQSDKESNADGRAFWYRIFNITALLLFLAAVFYLFRTRLGGSELYHFLLPSAALVALLLLAERGRVGTSAARFRALFRLLGPFIAGALAPIIMFLLPYARSGALTAFFTGVSSSAVARSVGLGVIRPVGIDKC